MQARILFLGTAGDTFVIGKQMRSSAGIALTIDTNQFYLDPGPGTLVMAKMMGLNIRENTAVFVSGNDIARAADLNAVISAMTHDGIDKKGVLVCPSDVVNSENTFVSKAYKTFLEKTIIVENTRKIGINDIDIEIIELEEGISKTCGFRFITPKFSLGYLPDVPFASTLGELFKDTDILIMSVQDPRGTKRKEHLNSEDAEKIIRKAGPQLAVITGFGIKMLQADPLYEAREMQRETGIQVIAAKDGMTINPMSFTTAVKQKNLTSFQ